MDRIEDKAEACVADEAGLRALYDPPSELARLKQLDRLDRHCRNFIAHSPFLVIGSARPGHGTDVSPRGDAPGFVQVLDDRTLVIPDRPGNNRLDTMSNLTHAPDVGLIFFIPGIDETLRVNGTASLTRDPEALAKAAVTFPSLGRMIVEQVRPAGVSVEEADRRVEDGYKNRLY